MRRFHILLMVIFSCSNYSVMADDSYSKILGYPETPNMDKLFTATDARTDSIVHPEEQYPDVTGGMALRDASGNLIVLDDIEEPKCVFYGTHVTGSGDAEINSEVNIGSLDLECD